MDLPSRRLPKAKEGPHRLLGVRVYRACNVGFLQEMDGRGAGDGDAGKLGTRSSDDKLTPTKIAVN